MIGTRWTWPVLAVLVVVSPALAGKKPRTDAQVRRLTEAVRSGDDERRRRAAVAELRDADPRTHTDVIPALVAALRRDPSAAVRADAADAIGQFGTAFPTAGVALEAAAESDPDRAVRESALRALWEYHLIGYRSTKGADGFAGQTAEPPIARTGVTRPAGGVPPRITTAPVVPVSLAPPPVKPVAGLPTVTPLTPPDAPAPAPAPPRVSAVLKRIGLPTPVRPGTRLGPTLAAMFDTKPAAAAGPRTILSATPPPQFNVTAEPPIAKPRVLALAPVPKLVGDVPVLAVPTFPTSAQPGGVMLPRVSAPPGPPVARPPKAEPPAVENEDGPRVEVPAVRVLLGLDRFKYPE